MAALKGKVKHLGMWIAFGVILLAAVVGLVVGITQHSEPTFREGALVWPSAAFPLGVEAWRYTAEGSYRVDEDASVRAAVRQANQRLGFKAFEYPTQQADIEMTLGAPAEASGDEGGHAVVVKGEDGSAALCFVQTVNVPPGLDVHVLLHELGECLGLDHDDYTQSVMYPVARRYQGLPPWYSDADRAAIRERYAP